MSLDRAAAQVPPSGGRTSRGSRPSRPWHRRRVSDFVIDMTAQQTPASPASESYQLLYDSRRAVHYPKPVWRGWLHLVWFEASVVIGTLLIANEHGALRITAAAIYAGSVSGLLGISALYHRGNWHP